MWKTIKINNESLMFKCNIDETKDEIKYILTNLKEMWLEYCTIDEVLKRSKECNRRIEYDNNITLETIQNIPNECNFTKNEESDGIQILTVKYSVEGRPFNFKWKLKKNTGDELLKLIIHPLLMSVNCLYKQGEELKKIIEKKDLEIKQYKEEGAVLRRSKIATVPFDKESFENNYPINGIKDMINLANINHDNSKIILQDTEFKLIGNKNLPDSRVSSMRIKQQLRSPRKAKNFIKLQISQTKRMKNEETKISYDDSDSCTPPMNLDEIKANLNGKISDMTIETTSQVTDIQMNEINMNEKNNIESKNNNEPKKVVKGAKRRFNL